MTAPHPLIWGFEDIDPVALELVPIAARRALDRAGVHLSLAGWCTLPLDLRGALVTLGAVDLVDLPRVRAIASQATVPPRPIDALPEPDDGLPADAPLGDERPRVERAWSRLGPLQRFAVLHAARSAQRRGDPPRLRLALAQLLDGLPPAQPA